MRFAERVFIILTILGILMHITHIQGFDISIFLGIFGLAFLYLFAGTFLYNQIDIRGILKKESYSEVTGGTIAIGALAGIIQAFTLVGILLRIQRWPVGDLIIYSGTASGALMAIIAFIAYGSNRRSLSKNILGRTFVVLVIALAILYR